MAAWHSQPRGDRLTSWKDWAIASVAVWLGAFPVGLALLALAYLLSTIFGLAGSADMAHPLAALYVVGYVLFFSPVLSWAGVLVALVPAWWLLRWGLGGWASFATLGLVAGAIAGSFFQGFAPGVAAAYGLLAALAFRRILFQLRPAIFTTC